MNMYNRRWFELDDIRNTVTKKFIGHFHRMIYMDIYMFNYGTNGEPVISGVELYVNNRT